VEIVRGLGREIGSAERVDLVGFDVDDIGDVLDDAGDAQGGFLRDGETAALEEGGDHDGVGDALVSSSRLTKTKPLAVPGRWRQMTEPAMVTWVPDSTWAKSTARCTPVRRGRRRAMGWAPTVRSRPAKSAVDLLDGRHSGQRGGGGGILGEVFEETLVVGPRDLDRPEGGTAIGSEGG